MAILFSRKGSRPWRVECSNRRKTLAMWGGVAYSFSFINRIGAGGVLSGNEVEAEWIFEGEGFPVGAGD